MGGGASPLTSGKLSHRHEVQLRDTSEVLQLDSHHSQYWILHDNSHYLVHDFHLFHIAVSVYPLHSLKARRMTVIGL